MSKMHDCPYEKDWDEFQMKKRINHAVRNGVTTCIITGTGEPFQNKNFLYDFRELLEQMDHPFTHIELQTTGIWLTDRISMGTDVTTGKDLKVLHNIRWFKNLGVDTISLSVSDVFDDANNMDLIGMPHKLRFTLQEVIKDIKSEGLNVRLSLNMLKHYDDYTPKQIIDRCEQLGAAQITFRKMYYETGKNGELSTKEAEWVKLNKCSDLTLARIKEYVEGFDVKMAGTTHHVAAEGKFLYTLPFGGKVYSIQGMSTVIDDDCMSKETNESLRYLILRENGKLYCQWDDEGSLIF